MARIAGVDLPRDKRVEIALTYIFGIGLKTSQDILAATGINPDTRARDLTEDEVAKLREYIDKNHLVEGDLRREISLNIKRLVEIGCYRGRRHRLGLPVRGQNTKNNARTRKGPKKTVMGKKRLRRRRFNKWQQIKHLVQREKIVKMSNTVLHTFVRLSIIQLLLSLTKMVMLYPGLVLVDLVSEVLEKALHLQLKWQQKLQQKQQWNMV